MSYVPLEDSNFNVAEKVNILFKSAMGFPSTLESKPWFQETAIKYNNSINGENIFLDTITWSMLSEIFFVLFVVVYVGKYVMP